MDVKEYTRRGGPWMSDIAESSVSEIAPFYVDRSERHALVTLSPSQRREVGGRPGGLPACTYEWTRIAPCSRWCGLWDVPRGICLDFLWGTTDRAAPKWLAIPVLLSWRNRCCGPFGVGPPGRAL